MKVKGTYLQNSAEQPLVYGDVELINPARRRLRGEPEKAGIPAESVLVGFCGTDFALMHMAQQGQLTPKFPEGRNFLINGHEGVVWIPSENRFGIVLIRGGNSWDPTRYTEEESYFEYGCDGADGLFSDCGYYNPDMLLHIPDGYMKNGKIPLSVAKKLVFCDPFACMLFQRERMEDLGEAHNFRVMMAQHHCGEAEARKLARIETFKRVCIFGLGTTGMFIGDLICRRYPDARIVYVARSPEDSPKVRFVLEHSGASYVRSCFNSNEALAGAIRRKLGGTATVFMGTSGANAEHDVAFRCGVLGCNGIYNSFSLGPSVEFDTMSFGFRNQLILGSINFRQAHMEQAIRLLLESDYDRIVELIGREDFAADPAGAYNNRIYCKGAPLKTAVVWNEKYVDFCR